MPGLPPDSRETGIATACIASEIDTPVARRGQTLNRLVDDLSMRT
jgi:hypothetical protein